MALSPVHKRIKLDPSASPSPPPDAGGQPATDASQRSSAAGEVAAGAGRGDAMDVGRDDEQEHCVICLHHVRDRTVLPCAHDRLCFDCILVWTAQSRKCPLCNAPIGPFLIHDLRSKYDYSKYYLPPLRTSPPPDVSPRGVSTPRGRGRGRPPAARWGGRARNRSASRERRDIADELELAVERRRWVYRHGLYAKHVAANPFTRYRPAPTPAQISAAPDIISRATIFVRRELRIWVNLDVEFLTTFILSLMKTLDLRSESAVKLLAEFLDMDTPYYVGDSSESGGRFANAEHFAHELYSYLRSPFRDLATYDSAVQYDMPPSVPPAPSRPPAERRRWDVRPQAEQASRGRRRRRSSPSPISRSPRDAYSRSPSPPYSGPHADYGQHGPAARPAGGSRNYDNGRSGSRDIKGKGKASAPPRVGAEKRRRDGDQGGQARAARRSPTPRAYSRSPARPPGSPPPDPLGNGRARPGPPPPAQLPIDGAGNETGKGMGNTCASDGSSGHAPGPGNGNGTSLSPRPGTPWGISIKGQAKKIAGEGEGLRGASPAAGAGALGAPKTRAATRNLARLDALHAHLGHGPPRARPTADPPRDGRGLGGSREHTPPEAAAPAHDGMEGTAGTGAGADATPPLAPVRADPPRACAIVARARARWEAGDGAADGRGEEARRAEAKLRGQALLRVRLAAARAEEERRRGEGEGVAREREAALRAALAARRGTVDS